MFISWLFQLPDFMYDEKVLRRYLSPKRKKVAKTANKKNAKSIIKKKNLLKIKTFITAHLQVLQELEDVYNVSKEVIASIYSHETRLGKYRLPHVALDVLLSELIFIDEVAKLNSNSKAKRIIRLKRLARYSLVNLYKYWTPKKKLYSSWAGACGPMQFMPFNFHYLRDGNKDQIIDPANQLDSIAGAFNFLKVKGWTQELSDTLQNGQITEKMHKVILRYNANHEYASGILQTALKLK